MQAGQGLRGCVQELREEGGTCVVVGGTYAGLGGAGVDWADLAQTWRDPHRLDGTGLGLGESCTDWLRRAPEWLRLAGDWS